MKLTLSLAALALGLQFAFSGSAKAGETDQWADYVVAVGAPIKGDDEALRSVLRICEIDAFSIGGQDYAVLRAPHDGYLEAYLFARRIDYESVERLPVAWTDADFAQLPVESRLSLGTQVLF